MQLLQNVKPQPWILPEEVDELSCRLLDPGSIVNPARTPWHIPVNLVCYYILWKGLRLYQNFCAANLGGN